MELQCIRASCELEFHLLGWLHNLHVPIELINFIVEQYSFSDYSQWFRKMI